MGISAQDMSIEPNTELESPVPDNNKSNPGGKITPNKKSTNIEFELAPTEKFRIRIPLFDIVGIE